jgi:hypothetical protein
LVAPQFVLVLAAILTTAPFVAAAVHFLDLPLRAAPLPAVCLFLTCARNNQAGLSVCRYFVENAAY